jgi:NAD(P)-dependent dehydrogenase (short-subunit alcohol dehydrogenase family)
MSAPVGGSDYSTMVAVITGASRGLGAGLAQAFADEGVRLGLCARTKPEVPHGASGITSSVDVSDADAVDRFTADVVDQFGRIDLWINNAGVLAPVGPLADAEPFELRRHIDTNIMGVLHGSATFARHVRSRPGGGVLVTMSSGAATRPYVGWAPYCASKAAIEMITEVIAREERTNGLTAYALSPGLVDTDMQAYIRSLPSGRFPEVDRFRRVHDEDRFNSPAWVTRFILQELVDVTHSGRDGPVGDVGRVRFRVPDQS